MSTLFLENCFTPALQVPQSTKTDSSVFLRLQSTYWPPLFWWALFTSKNIAEHIDEQGLRHHFLCATKGDIMQTWMVRQEALKTLVPEQDHIVIDDFRRFIQEQMGAGYIRLYVSPIDDSQTHTIHDWRSVVSERDGQWLRLEQEKNIDVLEEFDSLYMDYEQIEQDYQNPKKTNPYILLGGELKDRWPNQEQWQATQEVFTQSMRLVESDSQHNGGASTTKLSGVKIESHVKPQIEPKSENPDAITPTQKASQNRTPTLTLLLIIAALLLTYTFFKS